MKIFDCFLFNGEFDLLEVRLKTLSSHVDFFVITEWSTTFSGKQKPLHFSKKAHEYNQYNIIYSPLVDADLQSLTSSEMLSKYVTNLNLSLAHKHNGKIPLKLHKSLQREIIQRDACIMGILDHIDAEDIILIGDVDEIPNPEAISYLKTKNVSSPIYFEMDWVLYNSTHICSKKWYGTSACKFKYLMGKSFDQLRFASYNKSKVPGHIYKNGGWHFSYIGDIDYINRKLDSMPFQGRKAQITNIFRKLFPGFIQKRINNDKHLLFIDCNFSKVNPYEHYKQAPLPVFDYVLKNSNNES